jgi:hypothetical protein
VCLIDEKTGEVHDYTRKRGVLYRQMLLPAAAPEMTRQDVWGAAEAVEKRKDARVAREVELALPAELTPQQQLRLAVEYGQTLVELYGVAVDVAIHEPSRHGDSRNHHAHLLMTTRQVTEDGGLGQKSLIERSDSDLQALGQPSGRAQVQALREGWTAAANRALESAGHEARVDHRSLRDQGVKRDPTVHLGPAATAIERRGIRSGLGDVNRAVVQAERQRQAAEQAERQRQAAEQAERQRQAAEQAERQRQAAEQAERQRQAAEQAERQRQAQEAAERQRQAAEQEEDRRAALGPRGRAHEDLEEKAIRWHWETHGRPSSLQELAKFVQEVFDGVGVEWRQDYAQFIPDYETQHKAYVQSDKYLDILEDELKLTKIDEPEAQGERQRQAQEAAERQPSSVIHTVTPERPSETKHAASQYKTLEEAREAFNVRMREEKITWKFDEEEIIEYIREYQLDYYDNYEDKDEIISQYLKQHICSLEYDIEKNRENLDIAIEKLHKAQFEHNSLGWFSGSRKKELEKEIEKLQIEIEQIEQELPEIIQKNEKISALHSVYKEHYEAFKNSAEMESFMRYSEKAVAEQKIALSSKPEETAPKERIHKTHHRMH